MDIADGFRLNQDEWVEAFSTLADTTVITHDFDLEEVCDKLSPDFILYEAPALRAQPLVIANPSSHPHIPRFGFQIQDTYCNTRVGFFRALDELNIHWIFSHMTEAAIRQSPELKSRTFSLSLLFDDKIFRDYGLSKDIPISIFGGFLSPEIYRWRAETAAEIADYFPTLIYAHPGYLKPVPRHKFQVVGEAYARLLNQSSFSLADTTRIDCLVRKHLEIPASGTVLIAPFTPVLAPYGFRDMENCILGSGKTLYDKIATVADHPGLYEKIRKAGYDLVHTHYRRDKWRGILDFYECLRTLKPGETIRQEGLLGPFKAVPLVDPLSPAIEATYPASDLSGQIDQWIETILRPNGLADAERQATEMSDWLFQMTEQWVPLGIIALLKGNTKHAREFFLSGQRLRHQNAGCPEFDPEELAWLSLTAALSGDTELLHMTRQTAQSMQHLSLRRIKWLGEVLGAKANISSPPHDILNRHPQDRLSVHWMTQLPLAIWLDLIRRILDANGQKGALE